MPGGARSRHTIDCAALGGRLAALRFTPSMLSEGEKLSRVCPLPARARCPGPAPRTRATSATGDAGD
eukprot:scaffold26780_cov202-Isochrysis_galbana.AAC.1